MSHNIPQSLLNHASEVAIDFDVTKLTQRQLANVRKNVLNGHSPYNSSATSHLTTHILNMFRLAHFRSNGWRLYWRNMHSDHHLYETTIGYLALEKLNPDNSSSGWRTREIDEMIKVLTDRKPNSYLAYYHMGDEQQFREYKKKMVVDHSDNAELVAYMDKLKSGEIQKIRMVLWKNSND